MQWESHQRVRQVRQSGAGRQATRAQFLPQPGLNGIERIAMRLQQTSASKYLSARVEASVDRLIRVPEGARLTDERSSSQFPFRVAPQIRRIVTSLFSFFALLGWDVSPL